ncbi:MAG: ABC transporter ATP-binding protein [Ignavibacteriae bacterium]|nr:ABC transporter ATP-binding protein [Ignavibacteriota bacterium]
MNSHHPLLRCEDLHKSFSSIEGKEGGLHVLKGINLTIEQGEMTAIVGASGSGKSTLLHILGGIDTPTNGKVFWQETELSTLKKDELTTRRGKFIGFVFQFHHLLNEFTAIENVMLPMLVAGEKTSVAKNNANEILKQLELSSRTNHKPNELSGGEQQRVAIGRAIANTPLVILADEPTGNLDSVSSLLIYDILKRLNQEQGMTVIVVTHNEQLSKDCKKTYKMFDGQLQLL